MKIKLEGKDLVVIVLLIGAFTLRGLGINTITEWIILGIAVAYGAVQLPRPGGK